MLVYARLVSDLREPCSYRDFQAWRKLGVARTSNCALFTAQIGAVVRRQVLVEHRVETACFVLISVDSVLDVLGCVTRKMIYYEQD